MHGRTGQEGRRRVGGGWVLDVGFTALIRTQRRKTRTPLRTLVVSEKPNSRAMGRMATDMATRSREQMIMQRNARPSSRHAAGSTCSPPSPPSPPCACPPWSSPSLG